MSQTFNDLWTRNEDALGKAFDPGDPARTYDGSSADAALAQRLAFWTGRDCERILRLMKKSALVREKWDREDYLPRTVLSACNRQQTVYNYVKPEKTIVKSTQGTTEPAGESVNSYGGLILQAEMSTLFAGCVYISDMSRIMVPDGSFLKQDQFKAEFGGYRFMLDDQKTTRNAWEAFTESSDFKSKVRSSCFRPDLEPGVIIESEGKTSVNTWVPVKTERTPGDVTPFTDFMERILPDGNDRTILLSYMAALVQYPGVKFQWAPLIQGTEGNGKSLMMTVVGKAVGSRYTHKPNAQDIGSKFNSWIQNKLFIAVEEIHVGGKQDMIDALKPLITDARLDIQAKGQDQVTGDNRANFMLCTNHKDAMPVTQDTRRYCVFYSGQQCFEDIARDGMGGDYFPNIYNWLASGGYAMVTDYLHSYKIEEKYNPATHCHRAPRTSSFGDAVVESRGGVEQEIMEAIGQGRSGFRGGWVSSIMLERLLEEKRMSTRVPQNKRRGVMRELGYEYHKALPNGRTTAVVTPDGGKPRLFVKSGSIPSNIEDRAKVMSMYSNAQLEADTDALQAKAATTFGGK